MVAVGLQSIGYRQFYARVFERIGIEALEDDITGMFHRKEDAEKLYRKERRRNEDVKIGKNEMTLPEAEGRGGEVEGGQ